MSKHPLKKSDIALSFSKAAKNYDKHALIQKEIGSRLLARLDLIKNTPKTILDVGAGTGFFTRLLQKKYHSSHIVGLDLAEGMVHYAQSNTPRKFLKRQPNFICADMELLPFRPQTFDLIFSNFSLQWCFNLAQVFAEFKRILKPNGFIFFSTLGPLTLYELRQSFAPIDHLPHVHEFLDLHDYGDLLLKTNLQSPVVDMEMITITYQKVNELLTDLKATGAKNMSRSRFKGFTAKDKFTKMISNYDTFKLPSGHYPATFEVIYGHAFVEEKITYCQDEDGVVRIPGNRIPKLVY